MISRPCMTLWIAFLLIAAACGGATTDRVPDWGSGMTYSDCSDEGLTDYGLRTGQKWIGDFYADLYECAAPSTTPTDPAPPPTTAPGTTASQAPATSATSLPPLRGLRYEPVLIDVRGTLGDESAMPIQIVGNPGGRYNYMITREGRVWILEENTFSNPPVLDLRDSIAIGAETGMLGIALHPVDPRRMFLHYTDLEFDIIIAEYRLDERMRTAIPSSAKTLMKIPTQSDFHKGGMIAFGPKGFLYIGVGDDGSHFNGQNSSSFGGAILRIDVDSGDPYGIPTDHPPFDPDAPEVYLHGLRNPWRFWIDPETNLVYIGDVGADAFEEINVTSLDSPGVNFGWGILEAYEWGPYTQGKNCRENPDTCDTSGFTPPVLAIAQEDQICAVVGGVVYRGKAIPELTGHYFYGDVCAGFLRSFSWNGTLAVDLRDWTPQVGALVQLLSFGVDTTGEMYMLTIDNVFRIAPVR